MLIAALHDHAVAVAYTGMARRAVDIKALLPAIHHIACQRERQLVAESRAVFAGEKVALGIKLLRIHGCVFQARHRSLHRIARGALIGKERVGTQRDEFGLVMHVLAAAGHKEDEHGRHSQHHHAGLCRSFNTAPPRRQADENLQENVWSHRDGSAGPGLRCTGKSDRGWRARSREY